MSLIGNYLGSLAYYKHARGDYKEAERLYELAVKKGLNKIEKLGTYAVLVMRNGEFERALDMFNKMILMHPKKELRLKIRQNRAIANIKLGNIEAARIALEDIHKSNRTKKVYQSLGYLYALTNDKKSESYNLEAYDYDEYDTVILDNLTQHYINNNDYLNARIYAEKALDLNNNLIDVLYHLALIEEHDKNKDKAKEYANSMMDAEISALNDVSIEERDKVFKRIVG